SRDYVLLDNLYCNGEVSVDGHSWCDAAIATDFNTRSWTMSYSKHGKVPGNEEMETPANGYLWDLCQRHGVTYRNYGEGAQRGPADSTLSPTASMIRTMELILALPPLTQYDAAATPMFYAFQKDPILTPYLPLQPKVDLAATNPLDGPFSKPSAKMDFKDYDR